MSFSTSLSLSFLIHKMKIKKGICHIGLLLKNSPTTTHLKLAGFYSRGGPGRRMSCLHSQSIKAEVGAESKDHGLYTRPAWLPLLIPHQWNVWPWAVFLPFRCLGFSRVNWDNVALGGLSGGLNVWSLLSHVWKVVGVQEWESLPSIALRCLCSFHPHVALNGKVEQGTELKVFILLHLHFQEGTAAGYKKGLEPSVGGADVPPSEPCLQDHVLLCECPFRAVKDSKL